MIRTRGFGFIEIMVVVSILLILSIMSIGMLNKYLLNAKIRSTAEEIKEALVLARAEAIKMNDTVIFTASSSGGWKIEGYIPSADGNLAVIRSKHDPLNAESQVEASNMSLSFNGIGRTNNDSVFKISPINSACGEITCLNIEVSKLGKTRLCNPNSSHELLKCSL